MRLVSALLFVALTGSTALADESNPADSKAQVTRRKVPLRVVKLLPETGQVLLFDRNRGTHVVAEVGQDIDGFLVDEIVEDEVTLISPTGAEIILAAPDPTPRRRAGRQVRPPVSAAKRAEPQPVDPYADAELEVSPAPGGPSTNELAPGEGGVRVASASDKAPSAAPVDDAGAPALPDPYADLDPGIAAFVDAVGAVPPAATARGGSTSTPQIRSATAPRSGAPTPAGPNVPADAAGALAAAATGSPAAPAAASPTSAVSAVTVSRGEVDAALADFGATAVTFDAGFVTSGLRFDHIAAGTILAKLGLRAGDVLTAVDGKSLRSLDDAASLYARAGTARSATLSVLRRGTPMTLRVTIR